MLPGKLFPVMINQRITDFIVSNEGAIVAGELVLPVAVIVAIGDGLVLLLIVFPDKLV